MKVSYLLDILVGGVCNIYELPVGEVGKKVPIGLPHFFVLVVALGGIGQKWREGRGVVVVLCCVCWYIKMTILQFQ